MKCDLCGNKAVTFIKYNGSHLCADHFMKNVEKRVKREIRRQVTITEPTVIGVAVSGGKDSMVTLHIMNETFKKRKDVEIHCITVDEGIDGYRPPSVERARKYCEEHDIPMHIRSFKETVDLTMDEVAPLSGENSPCTYCGVFRRKCMNDVATEIGAKYLATGHNLDDMAQSIMMNFTRGDIERLARLGPHKKIQPGLVPRILPLRTIPEKESLLYAIVSKLPYYDGECPYWAEALRNQYRDIVDMLESRSPGSKFSILSSYDQMYPMLTEHYKPATLNKCECGEPTLGKRCKSCQLSQHIHSVMNEKTE